MNKWDHQAFACVQCALCVRKDEVRVCSCFWPTAGRYHWCHVNAWTGPEGFRIQRARVDTLLDLVDVYDIEMDVMVCWMLAEMLRDPSASHRLWSME